MLAIWGYFHNFPHRAGHLLLLAITIRWLFTYICCNFMVSSGVFLPLQHAEPPIPILSSNCNLVGIWAFVAISTIWHHRNLHDSGSLTVRFHQEYMQATWAIGQTFDRHE